MMRPPGRSLALGLFGVSVGACSLTSLDGLQDFEGQGGGVTGSASASSGRDVASAASGQGASSTGDTVMASAVSTSSSASQSSAGGSGGEGGGGGPPTSAYAQAVLADGPIAYLHLDEEPGDTAVTDAVGSYDGTIVGGVTWREPGAIANDTGTSIRFDGGTGQLILGDVLDFPGGGPFTVELWAKTGAEELPAIEWLFSKEADYETDRKGYTCLISTERQVGAELWAGFPPTVAYFDGPLTKEVWHHVVMTASATSLDLWVDGLLSNDGGDAAGLLDNDGALTFGAQSGGQGHFDGWLDEIAVYDVELSAEQIAEHFAKAQ